MASVAFHLDDLHQADMAQRSGETFAMPRNQIVQHIESTPNVLGGHRFFQEQFRAGRQRIGALAFRGVAGQHGDFNAGITAFDDAEQLQAVEHRHVDVQHREVNLAFQQD